MDGTGGEPHAARRRHRTVRMATVVSILVGLAGCAGGSKDGATTTVGSALNSKYALTLQWQLGSAPITRSLFLRRGSVIAAGELTRGLPVTEAVTAIDAATGTLRWSHPLRDPAGDPQAVAFAGQTLRILAAEEGVYISNYGGGGILNPIVGYAVGTGVRLFPSEEKLEASKNSEEVVGTAKNALVTSVGVLRDPATGVVRRLKFVDGTVLAIAGSVAFAWDGGAGTLTAYDLATDRPSWTVPMPIRPTVVAIDATTVLLATATDWRRLDVATGSTTALAFGGIVDPLSTFDTCRVSDFQSVPVGRYASPISCDDTYVAASHGDRVEVYDLATDTSVRIAVCDPSSDPFAVAGGLFACATKASDGRLAIHLIDASSGFQVYEFSDDRAAPVGLVMSEDQVIVSLEDGSIVAYGLTR